MGVHHHKLPIVTDGLVFQVDASNKLGDNVTNVRNIVTPTETGSFVNGASVVDGSFDFDGVDDYIDLGIFLDPYIVGTTDFTIDCWVYKERTTIEMIFSAYNDSPNRKLYLGFINDSIRFLTSENGNTISHANGASLTNNNWYNITVSRVGSGGNGGITMYVNGISQVLSFSGTFGGIDSNPTTYRIGNRVESVDSFPLQGKVSNMKLYNRALTATEITQNYEATKHNFE